MLVGLRRVGERREFKTNGRAILVEFRERTRQAGLAALVFLGGCL